MRNHSLLILFLVASSFILHPPPGSAAPPQPPFSEDRDEEEVIEQKILESIQSQQEYVLGFLVYNIRIDALQISQDGKWAIAYLEMSDPVTGETIPAEPGLVIARHLATEWTITLPADAGWSDLVRQVPEELLTEERKNVFLEMHETELQATNVVYTGYLLPWEAGKTVYLSQSVGHDRYIPSGSAHFAFDFYISKTMYRLYASKAGTVWRARWDVPDGDDSDMGNYLILQDTTTTPTTYQLYLHLAQDSIPPALRTPGTYVAQGQFIGIADDTGQSTGHHLHFHVHSNPNSYWGTALDITFADVDINGGRPRVSSDAPYCQPSDICEDFRAAYISGNVIRGDLTPPQGDLTKPVTGTTIETDHMVIEGWTSDVGSGVDKAQIIANYDGIWHTISEFNSPSAFTLNWDMCTDRVPNGPVSLAVRVWDREGNPSSGYPGLTHIIKDYDCQPTPPACIPDPSQIALFTDTDFRGDCVLLNQGDYGDISSLNPVYEDDVESILVGEQALATLFSENNFSGRSSTHPSSEANLNDNPIGNNSISSLKVLTKTSPALIPQDLVYPWEGATLPGEASVVFHWRDAGGGVEFQVKVTTPFGIVRSPWVNKPFWHFEKELLSPGNYSWKVRARSCAETSCWSTWSKPATFSVSNPPDDLPAITAPFVDDLEIGDDNWISSGLWNRLPDNKRAHSGTYSWYYGNPAARNYSDGKPNSGDLTTRPISIPSEGYGLRFWYRYETESDGSIWDQRWVQISENEAPFRNVLQLFDEVQNEWLQATLDLGSYAGKTIRIRFHFASLDQVANADFEGWYIDDLEVLQLTIPGCSDNDNTPSKARLLMFGQTLNGKMCPTGDIDYYKFEGKAGDHIVLDIDTPSESTNPDLDLILYLLDADGASVLAIHDDEIYAEKLDPHLGYQLTHSGKYYVKARLWAYPTPGGEDFTYQITLKKDNRRPTASFTDPPGGVFLPNTSTLKLNVNASDTGSGIREVEFFYHPGDWASGSWERLGSDQESADGWSFEFNLSGLTDQKDIAFFANVYDWAGNWRGVGVFDLAIDRTPPVTSMKALTASQISTAILLEWTGNDNLSGIEYYELQTQAGKEPWSNYSPNLEGSETQVWFVGNASTDYGFRLRGVDLAGNREAYPLFAETQTSIPSANDLCSDPDQWDRNRDDNTSQNAVRIEIGDSSRIHNFCNPLRSDRLNDEDWVRFSTEKSETYLLQAIPLSPMSAAILELYGSDGSTLFAEARSKGLGEIAQIIWKSSEAQEVYLRARHLNGAIIGNPVAYRLVVAKLSQMFLPFVSH